MRCNHKVPRRQTPKPHFSCKSVFVLPLLMLLMQETIMLLSVCNRIAQLDKFLQKDSNAKNASLSSRQFMCKAFLHSSTYPLLFYHYIPHPLFDASDFTQTGQFLFTGEGNLSTLSVHQERSSFATHGILIFASKFPFSALRAQSLTDSRHLKKREAIQNLG